MEVRFLCCKESVEDAIACIKDGLIAFRQNKNIPSGDLFYIIYGKNKNCYVCGRGYSSIATTRNTFQNPELYKKIYDLVEIETCTPFSINELSKEELGSYWGMNLQSSSPVRCKEYIEKIADRFEHIDLEKCISILRAL